MSDSLSGLGTSEIFPLEINWIKKPKRSLSLARILSKYPGTSTLLESFTEDVPLMLNVGVLCSSKYLEYTFLDFWNERRGKAYRFWIKNTDTEFYLKVPGVSGQSVLYVYRNGLVNTYQDYERIWIAMNNGDLITRHVTSLIEDVGNDWYALNLDTPLDRDIPLDSFWTISRLLLVRFESDKLTGKWQSPIVSEFSFGVTELVKEYG